MSGLDGVFNVAKGKIGYYVELPAANDALKCVLLKSSGLEADGVLTDHEDLASVLSTNTECDFTNYARQTLSSVSWSVDHTNDRADGDADDISFASAGGAANNTIAKLLIVYDPDTTGGTDADIIPLTFHDYDETTTGTTLNIALPSGGWVRAMDA